MVYMECFRSCILTKEKELKQNGKYIQMAVWRKQVATKEKAKEIIINNCSLSSDCPYFVD